ncbi:transposase IS3/IS911 family protein [Agrobacterium sp. RAC06]|nr:transposase IS3/IS911 family protein [Agrobacterium sp. RAC06]
MAGQAVVGVHGVIIAVACRCFHVSKTCSLYSAKLNDDNEEVADLPVGLTRAKKTWGFGLCFLYLRNMSGDIAGTTGVCAASVASLRIKPRWRLKQDKPDALTVPEATSLVWSRGFMADRLEDGRQFRLLKVLDNINRWGLASK